jgi:hypothetical protein
MAEVLTVKSSPTVTSPLVAVNEIPESPEAVRVFEVVALVPVRVIPPLADKAAVTESAPVAGTEIVPPFVVVIELEIVTAAPFTVTGPATAMVPPEIVTPDVLPVFPMRRLLGGPAIVKLVVLNVDAKFALEDSNTTAPVVRVYTVGVPFNASPITVTSLAAAVVAELNEPKFTVPAQCIPFAPEFTVSEPPLAKISAPAPIRKAPGFAELVIVWLATSETSPPPLALSVKPAPPM